jgi:hypothetical protein
MGISRGEKHPVSTVTRRGCGAGIIVGLFLGSLSIEGRTQEPQPDLSSPTPGELLLHRGAEAHVAAGAIFVISSEDIRGSGMSDVAELLRTAPGLDVAEIDANKWAISSCGFSERFADKMLVLLDGRTLYTSLSSGVNWGAGNDARRSATLPRTSPLECPLPSW